MLIDTHAHFSSSEGTANALAALDRARESGVEYVIIVGGSPELNDGAERVANACSAGVSVALGLDRAQAADLAADGDTESIARAVQQLEQRILRRIEDKGDVVAVGEVGLDYHYEKESRDAQRVLFAAQLRLAARMNLPVIVHSREADADTLELITKCGSDALKARNRMGVLHCFTGTQVFARELLAVGMMISFSGILTFRNAESLRSCAAALPEDVLLVETDCPYLAPVPLRGERNEPANVRHVAEAVARARGDNLEYLIERTGHNARRLFALS